MRKTAIQMCSVVACAGVLDCVLRRRSSNRDGADLTPPPAYTPPPKGTAPAEDTPAQREALAKLKASAERTY